MHPEVVVARFHSKIAIDATTGCWNWTAAKSDRGYGRIWVQDAPRQRYAHRVAYEIFVGAIPEGLEIDHLCRNRGCVNPEHLEAVTTKVNQNRGYSVTGKNLRKTHCVHGHPFDEQNTYRPPSGGRQCLTCRKEYRAAYQAGYRQRNREKINEYALTYKREWRAKRRAAGLPTH